MITVVLAEDHHIVRQGLKALLSGAKDFRLLGEAGDGLEAVALVARFKPNVLVLDLMIPRLHGLEVVRRVHEETPATHVIVLSAHADEHYVVEALRSGALGYVLKDCTTSNLVEAIQTVAAGKRYLSTVLAERAMEAFFQNPGQPGLDRYETLTDRERLILQLAAEGSSNPEIARKLFISPRTAESHRANLMRKLGLRSQTDLVRYAIRKQIITA
ncbi:MAG: response regulator transcription factor [Verrucomicrobiae bacterium]|nr:response regulator transcription factor [Verrucomicrobiae bacterium]